MDPEHDERSRKKAKDKKKGDTSKVVKKPKKSKPKAEDSKQQQNENEDTGDNQGFKKKNLQIEVIDHPEADTKAEKLESGEGSEYEQTDPNQYTNEAEPNHREGTKQENSDEDVEVEYEEEEEENEEEYTDSMEDNKPKGSLQSFGKQSDKKPHKGREDVKVATNDKPQTSGIQAAHLNEFMNKNREGQVEPTESEAEGEGNLQYTEDMDDGQDEDRIDDDLVAKQQREAEALLEETKNAINEEEQQVTQEEEEDEVEEDEKLAKENKYEDDLEIEEDEGESDVDHPTTSKGNKFELNYTVGRIEDGAAILISKDHNLIEIPL